jgi:hypothetical protein
VSFVSQIARPPPGASARDALMGQAVRDRVKIGRSARRERPWGDFLTGARSLTHHSGMDRRRFLLTSLAGTVATPLAAG